jgi:DNA-binding Lrp family transcriptional regulator
MFAGGNRPSFGSLLGKLFILIVGYVWCPMDKCGFGDVVMPMAYVLITTETGAVDSVLESLKKMDFVKETYMVYGVYDIVATVKAETMDKLREIVTWNLRSLDKVRSTLTMIVVEETE